MRRTGMPRIQYLHGSPTPAFERAVQDRLRIGKPGSGYILSSACSVAPHVDPGRLRRLAELAVELGKY